MRKRNSLLVGCLAACLAMMAGSALATPEEENASGVDAMQGEEIQDSGAAEAAPAAESATPWKVRRSADNTVLPLEYVHHPDKIPATESGEDAADTSQTVEDRDKSKQAASGTVPERAQATATPQTPPQAATQPKPQSKPASSSAARAGALEFTPTDKGLHFFVPLAATPSKVKQFSLDGPVRLVVDVYGAYTNTGSNLYQPGSPWVEKVVVGVHPEYLRLVIYPVAGTAKDALKATATSQGEGLQVHILAK